MKITTKPVELRSGTCFTVQDPQHSFNEEVFLVLNDEDVAWLNGYDTRTFHVNSFGFDGNAEKIKPLFSGVEVRSWSGADNNDLLLRLRRYSQHIKDAVREVNKQLKMLDSELLS